MIITIEVLYSIGQVVYLKTDPDQMPRIVQWYMVGKTGATKYKLSSGVNETMHEDFEITTEIDQCFPQEEE